MNRYRLQWQLEAGTGLAKRHPPGARLCAVGAPDSHRRLDLAVQLSPLAYLVQGAPGNWL